MKITTRLLAPGVVALAAMLSLPVNAPARSTPDHDNDSSSSDNLKRSDRRFVQKVAEGNRAEIDIAQLASSRSSNQGVRDFAQMLIQDHEKAGNELRQIAQQKGVDISSQDAGTPSSASMAYRNSANANDNGNNSGLNNQSTADASMATPPGMNPGADLGRNRSATSSSGTPAGLSRSARHDYRRLASENGNEFDRKFIDHMVEDHEKDIKMFEKESQDGQDEQVRQFASRILPDLRKHLQKAQELKSQLG